MKDKQRTLYHKDMEEGTENTGIIESEIIAGRNAVLEALKNGRSLESVNLAKGERKGSMRWRKTGVSR